MDVDSVALVKYESSIKRTLSTGIAIVGGFDEIESPVLIKPNICTMKDGTGHSVTDTSVVKSLTELILDSNDKTVIRIIESDSQSKNAEDAFLKFGYKDYSDEMREVGFDVSTVDLSQEPLERISFDGLYFKDPDLPTILIKPHYFISVAVAKTHYLSYITGVMKNLFGVLPRKDMSFYHSRIHEVISDLARIVRPNLNIIDARVGVEDWNGPKTHDIGAFILGRMPVSVDAAMTIMMSLNPHDVRHLVYSSTFNLGDLKPSIRGENIDSFKVGFSLPPL
ncbi:DUF362 domain-containing protein [Candidatus Thorarchaeota archaeon]|nr:MAG: DUF362 domain-containing protein [Candidatus Thorarchaeota archaeon]